MYATALPVCSRWICFRIPTTLKTWFCWSDARVRLVSDFKDIVSEIRSRSPKSFLLLRVVNMLCHESKKFVLRFGLSGLFRSSRRTNISFSGSEAQFGGTCPRFNRQVDSGREGLFDVRPVRSHSAFGYQTL